MLTYSDCILHAHQQQVKGWAVIASTKTTDLLRAVTIGSSSKRDRAIKPKKRKV
jgi:hypothetical protein